MRRIPFFRTRTSMAALWFLRSIGIRHAHEAIEHEGQLAEAWRLYRIKKAGK